MSLFTSFLVPVWLKPKQFSLSLELPQDTGSKLNVISSLPTFGKVIHCLILTNGQLSPAPVHSHFNICGILAEECFSYEVLTEAVPQHDSISLFSEFFSKGYIPVTDEGSTGREALCNFHLASVTDTEGLVAGASVMSHKIPHGMPAKHVDRLLVHEVILLQICSLRYKYKSR